MPVPLHSITTGEYRLMAMKRGKKNNMKGDAWGKGKGKSPVGKK